MNKSLLEEFKKLTTLTVAELAQRIFAKNNEPTRNNQKCTSILNQSKDLKILSPFYQRISQHKSNCKCEYHHKQKAAIKRRVQCKTQPDQILTSYVEVRDEQNTGPNHLFNNLRYKNSLLAKSKKDITEKQIDNYNNQDDKCLPNVVKSNCQGKGDYNNQTFEESQQKHNSILLHKHNTQSKIRIPLYTMQKIHTEGTVNFDIKRESLYSKKSSYSRQNLQKNPEHNGYSSSVNQIVKLKKIGLRGTGQTLELIDEENINEIGNQPFMKKSKFINSRPSFFGAIDDQQILKSVCLRFAHEDKMLNEEGKQILKQFVDTDIQIYKKVIQQMQQDIKSGLNIQNLSAGHAKMLVKIVLKKIQKEAKLIKNKDTNNELKHQLITEICEKFGWKKNEKVMGLQQFWRLRKQSCDKTEKTRKSLALGSKHKLDKKYSYGEWKGQKKFKSKVTIRESAQPGTGNSLSGFAKEKSSNKKLQQTCENSLPTTEGTTSPNLLILQKQKQPKIQEKSEEDQYKFNIPKKQIKKGIMIKNIRPVRRSKMNSRQLYIRNHTDNLPSFDASPSPGTSYFKTHYQGPDHSSVQKKYVQQEKAQRSQEEQNMNERNSSYFFGAKSNLHHLQLNKRFLRKVEASLINNDCKELIIDINDGIITKKRKIRAIHVALGKESIKKSDYYHDLIKYLDIYEEYCSLAVKSKKERNSINKVERGKNIRKAKKRVETQLFQYMDEIVKEKCNEQNQIDKLMEDLQNQRELKFVDIQTILDIEDPREELILKIPQFTTRRLKEHKFEVKRDHIFQPSYKEYQQIENQQHSNLSKDNSISQKDLEEKVRVTNGQSAKFNEEKKFAKPETPNFCLNVQPQFERKLKQFRKMLRLSTN